MSIEKFLEKVCCLFQHRLRSNLVGIYLHGSLAMGCFQPAKSDVDVLIIVREKLTIQQKEKIIDDILKLTEYKLEMSILLEKEVQAFRYPTPFELHYSQMHREKYIHDRNYLCEDSVDPDLAAHIVVTYERGKCLYGAPIHEVFQPINRKYYLHSILFDIENAVEEIVHDPVYYTLNLCRVLFYLKEGSVSSKKEGGEWGLMNIPAPYKELVHRCLSQYSNPSIHYQWNHNQLREFAKFMTEEIRLSE
ncbi:MAG: aminoglycoside adenylyltransferase domain-containing protein [Heyndrickxia sp.]